MIRSFLKADEGLYQIEAFCIKLLVPVMILITFLQVIFRYALGAPLPWSEELAIYLFIWVAFLGASVGIRNKGHYGLEIVKNKLPLKVQGVFNLFIYLVSFYFLAAITFYGAKMVFSSRNVSGSMGISMRWFYSAIPVGGLFMIVHLLSILCRGKEILSSARKEA
jgi:TRAP-type C4-dicarboxylate transport system permease small subunit